MIAKAVPVKINPGSYPVKSNTRSAIKNTLIVSGLAAFVTVTLALLMVYGIRLSGKKIPLLILPLTTI